jgi:hypothetical protein
MMNLRYKYVIGTHVMFYEVDILPYFVESLIGAIKTVAPETRKNIIIDFTFNLSEFFEEFEEGKERSFFENVINEQLSKLNKSGVAINYRYYDNDRIPYTMTDYRRWVNDYYCTRADYVTWGETDCLVPKEFFGTLEQIRDYASSNDIFKYIVTFATRKMWDDSWKVLEHPEFANCKYYERSDPETYKHKSSIHYTMTLEEMYELNNKTEEIDLLAIKRPKFDGSLLTISGDLLKFGVNIPRGFFGLSAEDTAFMVSCMKLMGSDYIQFVVKNILKVHNREHPEKRKYTKNSTQKNKGDWYRRLREINKKNLAIYTSNPQGKFLTWDDYIKNNSNE